MSQARTLTDAELDAVAAGDAPATAAVGAVSLSATGPPGVPVSFSITATTTAAADGPSSATVAVGASPGAVVVGTVLAQAVAPA